MSEAGGRPHSEGTGELDAQILRAKYHDYCSAQVAELFLLLSPDEIYVLAQEAARESGEEGEVSFSGMVGLLTERMTRRLALPPFEVWVEDYRRHPGRYHEYLLGLWEEEIRVEAVE
ncbi:MAG: hypothetical protein HY704_04790 [Gemmatimonadetes bacterium]|nr:hypothetical protein [Gemmatimonadota bacterium]